MEDRGFLTKILINPIHLPTAMLIIGGACYVGEWLTGSGRDGVTSPAAWMAWMVYAGITLWLWRDRIVHHVTACHHALRRITVWPRLLIAAAAVCLLVMLAVGALAAAYPPHLSQEYDAINYHYTLPRQHLIRGGWGWIPFLSADLFLMPLDYALASYFLSQELMNKLPQYVFFLGVLIAAAACCWRLSGDYVRCFWTAAAVAGSHGVAIQLGTAMFDVVMLYAALAALHSLWTGNERLAGIEAAFFFWSKPFLPLQWGTAIVVLWAGVILARRRVWSVQWGFARVRNSGRIDAKRFLMAFVLSSVAVAGPFLWRSALHAGTPLYPFFTPAASPERSPSSSSSTDGLAKAAEAYLQVRDQYGRGRSIKAWLKHLWLLAVPEHGVNNAYDYPLGLPYLLGLGPFLWLTGRSLRSRSFPLLAWLVMILWAQWWLGSHQSRFLFLPLVLMLIAVIAVCPLRPSLYGALTAALLMTMVSVARAHRHDLRKGRFDVLRPLDRRAVRVSRWMIERGLKDKTIVWPNHEAAFLRVRFCVKNVYFPWVIPARGCP